ncbi:uncharacterized protein LOC113558152 [Rhopalosiphum maidis]|uniref:uncharacterized protein LOC113558152 n=1 Tax=Rhopalosiphum maidis TaxID=43146 RepID=UPI000F00095F|nr:uncharacterized protein LOC113558152 [Rhopalosiphum maidis]
MAAERLFYVAMVAACCAMTSGRPSATPFPYAPPPSPSEFVVTASEAPLRGHDFALDDHFGHHVNQLQQQSSEQDNDHHFGNHEDDRKQQTTDDVPPAVGSSYHFAYAVEDPLTGDVKSQNEVSDGRGTVRGTYSLIEPDGSTRVVEYSADDEHGFNAEVKRIAPQHRYAAMTSVDSSESRPSPDSGFGRHVDGGAGGDSSVEIIRSTNQQNMHFYIPQEYVITSVRR